MITIPVEDIVPGHTLNVMSAPTYKRVPLTVRAIIEYPKNRVVYYDEGGFAVYDRRARIPLPW